MKETVNQPRLTLEDIKSALMELREEQQDDLGYVGVLYEIANDKQALAREIAGNKVLLEKFGDEEGILNELHALETKYDDQIRTIEAGKSFEEKVEKQSWGTWALEKVKSAVTFPVRHPIISLLILAALLVGVAGYMGYLPGLGGTFAGWGDKVKALFGLEGSTAPVLESTGALEAAREVANVKNVVLNVVEHDVFYDGVKYGIEELPALVEKLPALQPNQAVSILRDETSRATVEEALKRLLTERFGAPGDGSWVMPSIP